MSLKYSFTFLILSASCAASGVAARDAIGGFAVVFAYTAVPFLLLALAYGGAGPGLLGKQLSGGRSPAGWVLFGPYIVLNTLIFAAYRLVSREPAFVQVVPNVYFGRRLSARESVSADWVGVLDLAAEFAEARPLRRVGSYMSLPVLDATAPTDDQLRDAVAWVRSTTTAGPVYIHCALGHGRSASVVIAYLLAIGEVTTVADGVRKLRSVRPGVGLNASQRQRLLPLELRHGKPH